MKKITGSHLLVTLLIFIFAVSAVAQSTGEDDPVLVTDPGFKGLAGILGLYTADSLPGGTWGMAFYYNNWDREQSDLDVNDWILALSYGITDRLDMSVSAVVVRQVDYDYVPSLDPSSPYRYPLLPLPVLTTEEGFGDVSLGLKYTLMEENKSAPGLAVVADFLFPTGDDEKGLSSGEMHWGLDAVLSKNINKDFQLTANVGYAFHPTPEILDKARLTVGNELRYGVGTRIRVGSGLGIVGELAGGTFTGDENVEVDNYLDVRAGLELRFRNGLRMTGGYSKNLIFDEPAEDNNGMFFGLTFTTDRVYTISGKVIDATEKPMSGVAINFPETEKVIRTDENGEYSFDVRTGWKGKVVPELDCFTFSPAERTYSGIDTDLTNQNYVGRKITYQVKVVTVDNSGKAIEGVNIRFAGFDPRNSDASGVASYTVDCGSDGAMAVAHECYDFAPAENAYSNIRGDKEFKFVGTMRTYNISGSLKDAEGNALTGAMVHVDGKKLNVDASGNYSFTVNCGWSGKIVPEFGLYYFDPKVIELNNVRANVSGQSFTGYKPIVYFRFAEDSLYPEGTEEVAARSIDAVSSFLRNNPEARVLLEGNTCYIQRRLPNFELGLRRAEFVKSLLAVADRVFVISYGEEKPVAENSSETTRKLNRRVEFKVIDESEIPEDVYSPEYKELKK